MINVYQGVFAASENLSENEMRARTIAHARTLGYRVADDADWSVRSFRASDGWVFRVATVEARRPRREPGGLHPVLWPPTVHVTKRSTKARSDSP